MAKTIEEIMNREVFVLRPEDSAEQAIDYILALGITGAPVTDRGRRVIGHASLRDLLASKKDSQVGERMTTPVEVVSPSTAIDEAGRRMARRGIHRIIVTVESRVVGVVSTLDVMSALLGMPVVHPPAFARLDPSTGTAWTAEFELTLAALPAVPDGPGVFVLIEGAPLKRDWVVWIEASHNIRTRLNDLLSTPQNDAVLARILQRAGNLHLRATALADESERSRVVEQLKANAARWPGSAFHCETEHNPGQPRSHREV